MGRACSHAHVFKEFDINKWHMEQSETTIVIKLTLRDYPVPAI